VTAKREGILTKHTKEKKEALKGGSTWGVPKKSQKKKGMGQGSNVSTMQK